MESNVRLPSTPAVVSRNQDESCPEKEQNKKCGNCFVHFLYLRRTVAAFLGFLSLSIGEMQRSNLSFAIVDMVNSTTIDRGHYGDNDTEMDCPENIYSSTTLSSSTGEFSWNPEIQGYILSAGFIGGALGQIPGGIAVAKFGSKKIFVFSMLISSICNLLSPWIVWTDPYVFICLNFIKGFALAMNIVTTSVLTSNWFPKKERSLAGTFITSGFLMGTFLCFIAAGNICALELWNGWPLVFYIFGLLGVSLAIAFQLFYSNLPEEDPWISESELKYIQDGQNRTSFVNRPPTPWVAILKSRSIYYMIVALIGQRWMVFYFKIATPIYFGTILNLPIKQNGLLSSASYICAVVVSWLISYLSLWMNRHCKIETNRKFFNSFGTMVFCSGLIGMYLAKCDMVGNVIGLYIAITSAAITIPGAFITAVDVSPTFCGPVFGLSHSIGNLAGFFIPLMIGNLTNGAQNMFQWHKIMLISMGICFGCNLVWVFLGSTDVEPWDPTSSGQQKIEDKNKCDLETKTVSSKL